jgi:hypothetical protein
VLHIGMGKTGTSSIQGLLSRNRKPLREAGTLLYPRTPGRARHARLSLSVRPTEKLGKLPAWRRLGEPDPQQFREVFRRRLLREIEEAGVSRVLFSDEGLYGLPDRSLSDLAGLVARIGSQVRLVVYLRRQDDHLVSHYQQVVKVRETRRLTERIHQTDYARTHDYHARLRSWSRLVAPKELVVRRFEPEHFVEGSLYQDFFEAAAIPVRADGLAQVGSRNQSLDADAVEFLRLVNLLRREDRAAAAVLPRHNDPMVPRLAAASDGPVLTAPTPLLDQVMSRWESSNKAVAHEFVNDGDPLFRVPRRTRNTTVEQRLDPDRLDALIDVVELPEQAHVPLRALAEREARSG